MKTAMLRLRVAAGTAKRDEDLHALAARARTEHRPAVERSAARAAKASRLLADHGHLLPPDPREKPQDLLNEHEFRVRVAPHTANPGPDLAAIVQSVRVYPKVIRTLGDYGVVSMALSPHNPRARPHHHVAQPDHPHLPFLPGRIPPPPRVTSNCAR